MIPLLQRCYGGDPMQWLDMPRYLLTAYVAMYPRVLASEQVRTLSTLMLAQGDSKKPQWKQAVNAIERTARGEHGPAPQRRASHQEIRSFLRGLPVVMESVAVSNDPMTPARAEV